MSVYFSTICHVTSRKLRLPQCIMGDDLHIWSYLVQNERGERNTCSFRCPWVTLPLNLFFPKHFVLFPSALIWAVDGTVCPAEYALYHAGFDINGCPIARGKWNASSGKWKRHPTCPIGQVKMILWYIQFLKSKMINIELFSVGSRDEFYLNIASYILRHFVLFCWLRNSPFSNKDRVMYISQSWMPN
jgi:hypothetical protein